MHMFHETKNQSALKNGLILPFNLIDKMSLGAGALKEEGPIAWKGSVALEVTMATKPAPNKKHLRP